jgi:hypothetical protein
MKKVLLISLLLVSIFLIGNAEMALAQCHDYQYYECYAIDMEYGEVTSTGPACLYFCYDYGFEIDVSGPCFLCQLYPATGSKNLLGTADTCTQ